MQEPGEDVISSDSVDFVQGSSRMPAFPPRAAVFPSHRLSTEMREPRESYWYETLVNQTKANMKSLHHLRPTLHLFEGH
jgi:hypothetical protein